MKAQNSGQNAKIERQKVHEKSIQGLIGKMEKALNSKNSQIKKNRINLQQLENTKKRNQILEKQSLTLKKQITKINENQTTFTNQLKELRSDNMKLKSSLSESENKLSLLTKQNADLKNLISQMNQAKNQKKAKEQECKNKAIRFLNKCSDSISDLYLTKNNINQKRPSHETLQNIQFVALTEILLGQLEEHQKLSKNICQLSKSIKEKKKNIQESKTLQEIQNMNIKIFTKKQPHFNQKTLTIGNKTASQISQIIFLFCEQIGKIRHLQDQLQRNQEDIKNRNYQMNLFGEKIQKLKQNKNVLTYDTKQFGKEIIKIITTLNQTISFFIQKQIQLRSESQNDKIRIRMLEDNMCAMKLEYQNKIRDLENKMNDLENKMRSMKIEYENKIKQLEAKIEQRDKKIFSLEKQIQNKKLKIDQLQLQIQKLKAQITDLKKGIQQLEAQITDLKKRIQQLEAQITDLKKRIQQLEAQITDLKKRIQQLEAQITDLKKRIQQLNQKIKNQKQKLENETLKIDKLLNQLNITIASAQQNSSEIIDININLEEGIQCLKPFKEWLMQISNTPKYLAQSKFFSPEQNQMKNYLERQIFKLTKRRIKESKTIHQCDPSSSSIQWVKKLYDRSNILMLLRMFNSDRVIAFYSREPYGKNIVRQGLGSLISITKKKVYKLKPRQDASYLKYNPYFFAIGNDQIVIKGSGVITSLFGTAQSFLYADGDKIVDLFGVQPAPNREMKYAMLQFHQLSFD